MREYGGRGGCHRVRVSSAPVDTAPKRGLKICSYLARLTKGESSPPSWKSLLAFSHKCFFILAAGIEPHLPALPITVYAQPPSSSAAQDALVSFESPPPCRLLPETGCKGNIPFLRAVQFRQSFSMNHESYFFRFHTSG
jgi:hypothetical protein